VALGQDERVVVRELFTRPDVADGLVQRRVSRRPTMRQVDEAIQISLGLILL